MIHFILAGKIFALFLVMLLGWIVVRCGLARSEDSKVLSVISLYLVMPCVILSAFQVEFTKEVLSGLLLALVAAVLLHLLLIAIVYVLGRPLRMDAVERDSLIYSNAGNLIIPIVTSVLGSEWVIYSSAFLSVQLFLLWSHGKQVLCGEHGIALKKLLTNVNMIAVIAGLLCFVLRVRFPAPLREAMDSVGVMVGPLAMIILGMLIASMDLKKLLKYRRLWWIVLLRLVGIPLLCLLFLKRSGLAALLDEGKTILLISLLAVCTPSASTITQMAQLYDKDADYAGAINIMTTLLCIITMPFIVAVYQR